MVHGPSFALHCLIRTTIPNNFHSFLKRKNNGNEYVEPFLGRCVYVCAELNISRHSSSHHQYYYQCRPPISNWTINVQTSVFNGAHALPHQLKMMLPYTHRVHARMHAHICLATHFDCIVTVPFGYDWWKSFFPSFCNGCWNDDRRHSLR